MTDYLVKDSSLTAIANAIRAKGGTSEQLTYPNGFVSAIEAIETTEEGVETCTLGIKTENPNSNTDYVYYYYYNESGMREKTSVYLTTSYQTITFCDGFLAVYRGGDNVTATINFYDSYDNKVTSINVNGNYEYSIWISPTGYMVLNIAFLLEEYPNIEKISFDYID